MSYIRVIPRDLFNEANLLKCLGTLYIASERRTDLAVEFETDDQFNPPFNVQQDPCDGSIYVDNVRVTFRGRVLHCYRPLNDRRAFPLYASISDGYTEPELVFDAAGALSEEFLGLVPYDDLAKDEEAEQLHRKRKEGTP